MKKLSLELAQRNLVRRVRREFTHISELLHGRSERLEEICKTVARSQELAIAEPDSSLAGYAERVPSDFRGFAYEGLVAGLTALGYLFPEYHEVASQFLKGSAATFRDVSHFGLGLVKGVPLARLEPILSNLPANYQLAAIDGYGFGQGFFVGVKQTSPLAAPSGLSADAARNYDRGLGRSLWFVTATAVAEISQRIAAFATQRRGDLWQGVGFAVCYAGGMEIENVDRLIDNAKPYAAQLCAGIATAAELRVSAANATPFTEMVHARAVSLTA